MVSLEGLTKVVDPSQLTPEFDGCLEYNHEEWIEIRVAFEDYVSNAAHMLSRLEELQELLAKKELPPDLDGARGMIEEHAQLKKKVIKAPIEDLDLEGQKLLQRIQSSDSFPKKNSGSGNADLQSLLPRVSAMLDRLHSTRQHLHQMWHMRKLKLDQCFQLRLFEQDAEKVRGSGGEADTWVQSRYARVHLPPCLPCVPSIPGHAAVETWISRFPGSGAWGLLRHPCGTEVLHMLLIGLRPAFPLGQSWGQHIGPNFP